MYFDENVAEKAVKFVSLLKNTKGEYAKKNFNLLPFQEQIIKDLFGTMNDDGTRQYRESFIFLPRKNGKTELIAALVLYMFFCDSEFGQEIYSCANSRDQASLVFNAVCAMIRMNKVLRKRCKIIESQKRIVRYDTNSFYRAISADAGTIHGANANMVVYDEIHESKTRELYDVMKTSQGARKQPLFINITTAAANKHGICYQLFDYARKLRDGIVDDKTFYPVLFYADKKDDIYDEKTWYKCNPALDKFRNIDEFRQTAKRAREIPSLENNFRRLYLNQFTTQEVRWMPLEKWEASAGRIVMKKLLGRPCFAGLDLASTTDIAALVLVFPMDDGKYIVLPFFWIPEDNMKERVRRDRVPYDVWVRDGLIEATEGNVIHYGAIIKKLEALRKIYNIQEIAYDRWGATKLSQDLEDRDFTMIQFGQGFASMSPPTKELMNLVLQKKLVHSNNEVLNWMVDNMIVKTDPAGNIKPDKSKSTEKIDGVVALIMGLDRALRNNNKDSVYDERGIIIL